MEAGEYADGDDIRKGGGRVMEIGSDAVVNVCDMASL